MQIRRFLCLNPTDGTNHCGKEHADFREAVLCILSHLTRANVLDQTVAARMIATGCVVGQDGSSRVVWDPGTVGELAVEQRRYLDRLHVGFIAESDDEVPRIWRRQLEAVRQDLARHPMPPAPVGARRVARKAA